MKRGFSACLPLALALSLSSCGYGLNPNKALITKPPGPGPGPGPSEKAMPEAPDHQHHLFVMDELMRVYQSSSVLLTSRESDDIALGCVQYKRIKDAKPRADGSLLFRTATYKACRWEQAFGENVFNWKIGNSGQEGEQFTVAAKELQSKANLNLDASLVSYLTSEAPKPDVSKLGLVSTYLRQVNINRPDATSASRYPFSAATLIGDEKTANRDSWRTHFLGDWLIEEGKIKAHVSIDLHFRQAKRTGPDKAKPKHFTIGSESVVTFNDGNCKRPLGQFNWKSLDESDHVIASGQFEAKSDGLHADSGVVIPWPKSCLEFTTPAFD